MNFSTIFTPVKSFVKSVFLLVYLFLIPSVEKLFLACNSKAWLTYLLAALMYLQSVFIVLCIVAIFDPSVSAQGTKMAILIFDVVFVSQVLMHHISTIKVTNLNSFN
jgi:hypothetical protein